MKKWSLRSCTLLFLGDQSVKLGFCVHVYCLHIWVFPKIVIPQNGWFIMENPIKMDDLGVPLFSETSIYLYQTFQVPQMEVPWTLCLAILGMGIGFSLAYNKPYPYSLYRWGFLRFRYLRCPVIPRTHLTSFLRGWSSIWWLKSSKLQVIWVLHIWFVMYKYISSIGSSLDSQVI